MKKLREIDKKQKVIIGTVIAAILLSIAIVFLLPKSGFDNKTEVNEQLDKDKNTKQIVLILEYGDEIENEYVVKDNDNKELTILTPKDIDTMKIGETKHLVETEDGKVNVKVIVKDTNKPTITGDDKFEVDKDTTKDDLEKTLKSYLIAEDNIDGKLNIEFEYDSKFDLSKPGEYTITAIAKDNNNNRAVKPLQITILDIKSDDADLSSNDKPDNSQIAIVKPSDKPQITPSKPAPSKPAPSKPAPSKPAPSKPAPSKPTPSKPTPSKPTPSKPAPSKPEFKVPSGIPKDAVLIDSNAAEQFHHFNYKRNLPSGGYISKVATNNSSEGCFALAEGYDSNNKEFLVQVVANNNSIIYKFNKPNFTEDDSRFVFEQLRMFLDAYGY